ncbi:MAG TPA: Mur ligase family protein, partial [Chloroflexota bacterium]|nr:Mur ligase family protein [Chloroflexota bacterium]
MKLSQLLAAIPPGNPYTIAGAGAETDAEITGVCYDSRRAGPGTLFVAVWHPGYGADGHDFVAGAVQAGAAAVVVQRAVALPPGTPPVPVVQVRHTPSALGWLAAAFYGFPASRLGLVGVTGTDGKTTTCTLTTAILEAGGLSTGMVTTVASKSTGAVRANQAHTSTPEAVEIQALLAETLAGGGTHAVLETTSHALHQDRLAGCEFDVAVVTRVTHEHLEYHGSYEAYLDAKGKLLDLLRPDPQHPKRGTTAKAAVLNADDHASYGTMAARAPVPVVSYALRAEGAQVRALDVRSDGWSSRARLVSPWGAGELLVPIPGAFNVYNALAALTAGCSLGVPLEVALAALAQQRGVSGRMER